MPLITEGWADFMRSNTPLRADTRSRRNVPSVETGLDRNLLPKKTVLRVANTFMGYFFLVCELQIYNKKGVWQEGWVIGYETWDKI
ncbi:MAG: hypothetical protein J6A00_05760 [Bacteroides sp.]|jgi:hypothetical protein|uniref:hypothetical protein n=1 Tax=Phocaeicola sartorii TaxID=671267 RepID=UPI001441578B|nr:hypothetical protein [Phocaeicola sartorii]MBO5507254.1 hypothetical protein [Bacteroides sp.]